MDEYDVSVKANIKSNIDNNRINPISNQNFSNQQFQQQYNRQSQGNNLNNKQPNKQNNLFNQQFHPQNNFPYQNIQGNNLNFHQPNNFNYQQYEQPINMNYQQSQRNNFGNQQSQRNNSGNQQFQRSNSGNQQFQKINSGNQVFQRNNLGNQQFKTINSGDQQFHEQINVGDRHNNLDNLNLQTNHLYKYNNYSGNSFSKTMKLINYENKTGLRNDSIINSEELVKFNNYLSIQIIGNDINFVTTFENFSNIIVTRNENHLKNIYPECHFLSLNDMNISNQHSKFEVYNNILYLGELGSSNGTFRKMRNNESIKLYPFTYFKFMNMIFIVNKVYEENGSYNIDIEINKGNIFTINSNEVFELSFNSNNQMVNTLIKNACQIIYGSEFVNGNFPKIIFDLDQTAFYLCSEENLVDGIYVKLNSIKINDNNIDYERFIVVQNFDTFLLSDQFLLNISFFPWNCYCKDFNEMQSLNFFKCCGNPIHPVCQVCYEMKYCYQCKN